MKHRKDSLWTLLNRVILERGYVSYGEIAQLCAEEGYKVETATRRLRSSESPDIEAVEAISKRGTKYISGYKRKKTYPVVLEKYRVERVGAGQQSML